MASWRQQLRRLMPLPMRRFAHRAGAAGFRLIDIGAQTHLHSDALWQPDLVCAREDNPWVAP